MARLLLVEDEPAIADTVLYALRGDGHEVAHRMLGREALDLARDGAFDLAILDVGLPDIDGFALCRDLRREHALPVIFLTAHGAEVERVLGLEMGADDYMVKPFSPRELAALLARPGAVFSRAQLMDRVWGDAPESSDRTVDTHVKTLRAKLRAVDAGHDPIRTHRGLGYSVS